MIIINFYIFFILICYKKMNNSIIMDVIISLSLIFIYYIYTKLDKQVELINTRQMVALFIINMVILNVIKMLFSCNISPVDNKCSIPFHDKPPF
jgi:hypothetical protein